MSASVWALQELLYLAVGRVYGFHLVTSKHVLGRFVFISNVCACLLRAAEGGYLGRYLPDCQASYLLDSTCWELGCLIWLHTFTVSHSDLGAATLLEYGFLIRGRLRDGSC